MKGGKTLAELATEVQRQAANKRDFVVDSSELAMLNGNELLLPKYGEFGIRDLAHQQIASHLGIPMQFYHRLQTEGYTKILDYTVNNLMRQEPATRLVRTMDGQIRALLSNRYQRRDNDQLMAMILPIIANIPDVQFPSAEITETRMYIKFVAPRIQGEVKKGDIVQAGGVVSNSEVGHGSLSASSMFFRLVCVNGAIVETNIRKFHVGRQIDLDEDPAAEIFSDATLKADDEAFWMKVADVVRATVDETNFNRLLVKMRAAADSAPMAFPVQGIRELSNRFGIADFEATSILNYLSAGGDLTRWGALNAVTRASQDVENYDRATELETLGGAILNMGEAEWVKIGRTPEEALVPARRRTAPTAANLIDSIG